MTRVLVRVAVSATILALLFLILPVEEIRRVASSLRVEVWIPALAAYLLIHRIAVEKWRLLMNAGRAGLRGPDAVRCYATGLFANLFLPSLVGGDVLRAGLIMGATRRRAAVILGSLADRGVDVAGLAFLLAIGGWLARDEISTRSVGELWVVWLVAVAAVLAAGVALVRVPLARWPRRTRRTVGRGRVALRHLVRQPAKLVGVTLLSMGVQTSMIALHATVAWSMGVRVPAAGWLVAWPLAKFAALLPISLGGLGVRDVTLAALLAPWGVSLAAGVTVGLAWQTLVFGGGVAAGAAAWAMGGRLRRPGPEDRAKSASKSPAAEPHA